jgi:dephospho-CoA kinase
MEELNQIYHPTSGENANFSLQRMLLKKILTYNNVTAMIIIGITGTLGAGKGTVVDFLVKNKNFKHFSVGDFIKEKVIEKGLEPNRDNMRIIGNEIRTEFGPDYITQKLFEKAKKSNSDSIIESIRNPKEARFIQNHNGYLFAVDANPKIRYERIRSRGTGKDNVTFEEFKIQEEKEKISTDPNAQNLQKCMLLSDYKFDNNGDINSLYEKVKKVIDNIKK